MTAPPEVKPDDEFGVVDVQLFQLNISLGVERMCNGKQ